MRPPIQFVPVQRWHLDEIAATALSRDVRDRWLLPERREATFRAIDPRVFESAFLDGRILGMAGVLPYWHGRGEATLVATQPIPLKAWPAITERARVLLDRAAELGTWRIEASVRADFLAGLRWAKRIGLEVNGLDRAYFPDGGDAVQYLRLHADKVPV